MFAARSELLRSPQFVVPNRMSETLREMLSNPRVQFAPRQPKFENTPEQTKFILL